MTNRGQWSEKRSIEENVSLPIRSQQDSGNRLQADVRHLETA